MIALERLDHLVLTVANVEATCEFYAQVLGCQIVCFQSASGEDRFALRVGNSSQKINLHSAEYPFQPGAKVPQPGSADLCFITATPLEAVMKHFCASGVRIVDGPVQRTGTLGPILSIYIRDLDGNLIEVANPLNADLQ